MFKKVIPFVLLAFVAACAAEPAPKADAKPACQCCTKDKTGKMKGENCCMNAEKDKMCKKPAKAAKAAKPAEKAKTDAKEAPKDAHH